MNVTPLRSNPPGFSPTSYTFGVSEMASSGWPVGTVTGTDPYADGTDTATVFIDEPPIFDGLIAAGGRLFVSFEGGSLPCFADR